MAQILLDTHGSGGDINPFLALGIEMRRRGHAVTLISNQRFEPAALHAGISFAPSSSSDDFEAFLRRPSTTDKRNSLAVLRDYTTLALEREVACIEEYHRAGDTVIVASRLAFGGLIAGERLGIPVATLLLNTTSLRSTHEAPLIPGVPHIPSVPGRRTLLRFIYQWRDYRTQTAISKPIDFCRAKLGLPPVANLLQWVNSPRLLIAAWPEWLYRPQPDWPRNAVSVGFLNYDGMVEASILVPAPEDGVIVFTAGTTAVRAHTFFTAAAEACELLGRRGILVTQYAAQVPTDLPDGVRHVSFHPFSELLPNCAAIVHHGGIGTCARALTAGVPQLIVPEMFDQFDNAARMERLGVGAVVDRDRLSGPSMARALSALLNSESVSASCREYAARLKDRDATPRVCDLIDGLLSSSEPEDTRAGLSR